MDRLTDVLHASRSTNEMLHSARMLCSASPGSSLQLIQSARLSLGASPTPACLMSPSACSISDRLSSSLGSSLASALSPLGKGFTADKAVEACFENTEDIEWMETVVESMESPSLFPCDGAEVSSWSSGNSGNF